VPLWLIFFVVQQFKKTSNEYWSNKIEKKLVLQHSQ
jgi:hypothetical protein